MVDGGRRLLHSDVLFKFEASLAMKIYFFISSSEKNKWMLSYYILYR